MKLIIAINGCDRASFHESSPSPEDHLIEFEGSRLTLIARRGKCFIFRLSLDLHQANNVSPCVDYSFVERFT